MFRINMQVLDPLIRLVFFLTDKGKTVGDMEITHNVLMK